MNNWKIRHKNINREKKNRGEIYSFIADQIEGLINIEIGNYIQLIESIQSGKDWSYCYDEIVDDYAFTLFNRLICMKVLESHGLYPEMITQRQQHSGKSYTHCMWLETNGQYSSVPFEGLEKYLSWQFDQLSLECDLFAVSIPLHMIPTATFCKEINPVQHLLFKG